MTHLDLPEGAPADAAALRAASLCVDARPAGGADALDRASPDETLIVFGLVHTDSNQHVNSLVYMRLFEEAVLRRFAALGLPEPVLARRLEIAYRKPCFAGDRMHVHT